MTKLLTLCLSLALFLLGIYIIPHHFPVTAQQSPDEVIIEADPPNYSFISEAGTSKKVNVNVRSNLSELVVYGFDWNKSSKSLDFNYSDWIRLPARKLFLEPPKPATHSFTLSIPSDTQPGEYYRLVTYSDQPFTCEESDSPPAMIGVPLNNLIIRGLPAGSAPASLEELQKLLHSLIKITGFQSYFSFTNQSQNFKFTLSNDGNLKAYFTGYILVKNRSGETVDKIEFDNGTYPVEPNQSLEIKTAFEKSRQMAGEYEAELYISYRDALQEIPPQKVDSIKFVFVGSYVVMDFVKLYGIFVLLFLLLRYGITVFFKPRLKLHHTTAFLLILAAVPSLLYGIYSFSKTPDIQGTVQSGTESISVTAAVRESTAFAVKRINGKLLITIKSQNSRNGWELWSFNCQDTRLLATDRDYVDNPNPEIILEGISARQPVLLITRFFD